MKKFSFLAVVALSAAFFACSDDSNSTSASNSSSSSSASDENVNDEESYDEVDTSVRGTKINCKSVEDSTASIRYEFLQENGTGTITRTYLPNVENGVDAACDKAKKDAAANDKVDCSGDSVKVVSTFNNQSSSDLVAMVKLECKPDKE